VRLERARGKHAFPAARKDKTVDVRILRVSPVEDEPPAVMEKVFDGGQFGLRPPWGRGDIGIRTKEGRRLPASWSREGSGIVGPVPRPGESVKLSVWAGAYRNNDSGDQVIRFVPPWEGEPLQVAIGNDYALSTGVLRRPPEANGYRGLTGTYRIYAENPYDPKKAGIRGFAEDLGVLIHKVGMELVGED
jgi:hypothetical protein